MTSKSSFSQRLGGGAPWIVLARSLFGSVSSPFSGYFRRFLPRRGAQIAGLPIFALLVWGSFATVEASFVGTANHPDGLIVPGVVEDSNLDNFTAGNSIGTIGFSALLHDGSTSLTFPVMDGSLGNNILYNTPEEGLMSASAAPGVLPNEVIYTFVWRQADDATLIPMGASFNNQTINCLSFEMGTANTGSNHLDVGSPFIVNHPDVDNNGIYEAEFQMFDTSGNLQATTPWFVATSETGFEGRVFIKNPANPDLSQFSIGSGIAQVSILLVPEPAGMPLYLLGLLATVCRRRMFAVIA